MRKKLIVLATQHEASCFTEILFVTAAMISGIDDDAAQRGVALYRSLADD